MSVWHDKDLEKCISFNVAENKWDGDCDDYWRSVVDSAAPGIFVACVVLAYLLFYIVARLCGFVTCVCRGCRVSPTGSSTSAVKSYRGCLFATWVVLILLAGLATHKHRNLYDSVKDVNNVVDNVRLAMVDNMDMVAEGTASVGQLKGMHNQTLEASVSHTQNKVHDWSHDIKKVKDSWTDFLWVIDLIMWVPATFLVLYIVTAVLNIHYVVPVVTFFFFLIFTLAAAGMQGSLGVASTFTTDSCDNFVGVNQTMTDFFSSSKYLDNNHVALLRSVHSSVATQYTGYQCNTSSSSDLQTLCHKGFFSCPLECVADVSAYIQHTTLNASLAHGACEGSCSITECATSCPADTEWRTLSEAVVNLQNGVQAALLKIDTGATPLVSASIFEQGIIDVRPYVCDGDDSAEHQFKPVTILAAIAAFFILFATILVSLGTYMYLGTVADEEERPLVYIGGTDAPYTQQPTMATVAPVYTQHINTKPDPLV